MLVWCSLLTVSFFIVFLNIYTKLSVNIKKNITYFLALIVFIVFGFNRMNNDYNAYLFYFENKPIFVEKGYLIIINILQRIGGNHNWIIIISGIMLVYFFFIKNKNKYTAHVIFLYSLNYLMFDITQIRNTILLLMISFGIYYSSKKFNKIRYYYLFNLIGASIQSLGILYFGFGLLKKLDKKKYIKLILILIFLNFILINIIKVLIIRYFPEKANIYLDYKPSFTGILFWYILVGLDILNFIILKVDKEEDIFMKNIFRFYLYNLIFLPLTILNIEIFSRLYRNLFLLKCILITNRFQKLDQVRVRLGFLILCFTVFLPIVVLLIKDIGFYKEMIGYFNQIKF